MSFTLHYDGAQFKNNGEIVFPAGVDRTPTLRQIDKLNEKFSNIGALVMRYHLGHGQRAGLIQQVARSNYDEDPVDKPGRGADQEDLFKAMFGATPTCQATRRLEQCAHATLGRGKVLNERAQPLIHVNSTNLHGEQHLWAIIHSTVWNTGINFAMQLNNQGFSYIVCPKDVTPSEYEKITKQLKEDKSLNFRGTELIMGERKLIIAEINKLTVDLDPEKRNTFQENGIAISDSQAGKAPLGWLVHTNSGRIVPQDLAVNAACVMRLAKGGFYELTKAQQEILQSGLLRQNGQGLFTQNQAFNAITSICEFLEAEYGFDPEKLLGKSLSTTYIRVHEFLKNPVNLEDFLTGPILTEMVQPLRASQSSSTRKVLPLRFTNPFYVTLNNTKAIAFAFDIKDNQGRSVLITDPSQPISTDSRLIDKRVNGELALPSFTYGKHAAAILSTGVLVAEQMFLEQLLREGLKTGSVKQLLENLQEGSSEILLKMANELMSVAKTDERGAILGVQFEYCDSFLMHLRKALGFDAIAELIEILNIPDMETKKALSKFLETHSQEELRKGLVNLATLGDMLQKNEKTSGVKEGSRGINAGILPLVKLLDPALDGIIPNEGVKIVPLRKTGEKIVSLRTSLIALVVAAAIFNSATLWKNLG